MTRRSLILAATATLLAGAAWWESLDRLSAEERLLVGTWIHGPDLVTGDSRWRFGADGRPAYGRRNFDGTLRMEDFAERWYVRNGAVVLDGEPSAVRRALRPALHSFGLPCRGTLSYRLDWITADELILVMSDGTRETWTRAPAE